MAYSGVRSNGIVLGAYTRGYLRRKNRNMSKQMAEKMRTGTKVVARFFNEPPWPPIVLRVPVLLAPSWAEAILLSSSWLCSFACGQWINHGCGGGEGGSGSYGKLNGAGAGAGCKMSQRRRTPIHHDTATRGEKGMFPGQPELSRQKKKKQLRWNPQGGRFVQVMSRP